MEKSGKTRPKDEVQRLGNEVFWEQYNLPFLKDAFKRGDDIRLLSEPVTLFSGSGFYLREIEVIVKGWKKPNGEILEPLMKKYNYKFNELTKTYEIIK